MLTDVLLVPIKAQNAMLTLRRTHQTVIYECFEASPSIGAVIGCKGSLLRTFPAHARAVRVSVFDDPRFRNELAAMMSKLDMEVIDEMMPQTQKAGCQIPEPRDTSHPGLVSDMLMAILASLGVSVKAQQISKRTRDDVLWDNTLLPWRRSPLWLAIRVTIQLTLCRVLPEGTGNIQYKNFMIYLISDIASKALLADKPADKCHVILAKLARRVHKLGAQTIDFVQMDALDTCQRVRALQSQRWDEVRRLDAERPTTVSKLHFAQDTALSLLISRPYLDAALAHGQTDAPSSTQFTPNHRPWLAWYRGLPRLDTSNATKEELVFVLAEFENWVALSLPSWVEKFDSCSPAPEDCMALAELGDSYWRRSETAYHGSPEKLSMMLLIIAEIWHAVDQLAIILFPLLKQYAPVVSADLFYPILLPKKSHMQRLHKVEQHIILRWASAIPLNPSIFSDPRSESFAVAYYATSASHQALRARIEAEASTKKAEKKTEWENASREYERLLSEAMELECSYVPDTVGWMRHSYYCRKCSSKTEANNMRISKYEWPLPSNEYSCRSAVFELDCPEGFVAWRNITWLLTYDIGRPQWQDSQQYADTLPEYSGLRSYFIEKSSRMILASKVKSFEKTHYSQRFPVTYDEVYSNNALQYAMQDSLKRIWVKEQTKIPSLEYKCIQPLPDGPYSNLQFAVDSTNHAQNEILARQDICSPELSLHEFISFGSLRADGEHTQWLNIQRELTASSLTFNTEAVTTLFLHAAFQVGSSGEDARRTSHRVFDGPPFCEELLAKIRSNLDTVKANWKSDYSMMLLVKLTLRTLTLAPNSTVISLALDTLRRIRPITQQWMESILSLLHDATEEAEVQNLQHRLLKTAMLCKLTYDVDSHHVSQVLNSESDLSTWVIGCVMVQENIPGDAMSLPPYIRRMYLHDLNLTHALHKTTLDLIMSGTNLGLDQGIQKVWPGFQSVPNGWTALFSPNERWLTTQTKVSSGYTSQNVQYNVLDGELLVDGRPLGRLPRDYLSSGAYQRVFGPQILNVFAADMPGMLYMTAQEIHGYLVYFTKREGRVVIKLRQGSRVLEYVPHETFAGDVPSTFVHDYAHWLDMLSHEIEFRTLGQWNTNSDNWRLRYQAKSVSHLFQRNMSLIDVRSATFKKTMDIFNALETWNNTHVLLGSDGGLSVSLPRYNLHFHLNAQGHFHCHELGRIVDPDQSLGTMIGLESKLILCGIGQLARKHDRLLIIPQGEISVSKSGFHVRVTISSSSNKVRLFQCRIDGILRRLQGSADIMSSLYMAYLHALTSFVLPDTFTGNTGTEEALAHLRQQSMSLTKPANEEILQLLMSIAQLTPDRQPYPKHLRVMQQVKWHTQLSMIAQHDDFVILAQQILDSGNHFRFFYPDSCKSSDLYVGRDKYLLARAKARNLSFLGSSAGGSVANSSWDVLYGSRRSIPLEERSATTFGIASLVRDWPPACQVTRDLLQELKTMKTFRGFGTRFQSSKPLSELLSISYATSWGSLLELCRSSTQQQDEYGLLFLFSTIAFGRGITDPTRLVTLLAFAFSHELRAINPPAHSSFTLSYGTTFLPSNVRAVIQQHMKAFSPSSSDLSVSDLRAEERTYSDTKEEQTKKILKFYNDQWRCRIPQIPNAAIASLLKVQNASPEINSLFAHWTRNGELQSYVNRAQQILNRIYEETSRPEYKADDWQSWQVYLKLNAAPLLPTLPMLMLTAPATFTGEHEVLSIETVSKATTSSLRLSKIVEALGVEHQVSSIRKQYSDELLASLDAYSSFKERLVPNLSPCSLEDLLLNRMDCETYMEGMLEGIRGNLRPNDAISKILEAGGLWPGLTIRSILGPLANLRTLKLPLRWRSCLLALGEAITFLQRGRRLVLAGERKDVPNLCAELENAGRAGWESKRWPEWLLIEIENDLLIRPNQAQVALEMLSPSSSSNSLAQLNMVLLNAFSSGHRVLTQS